MSQHDLDIANQGFAAFRADLNNALKALGSLSSGDTAPATPYANQLWYETDTNTLHIRDEANSAWLDLMVIDQSTGSPSFTGQTTFADGSASSPSISNIGDTNAGIFFPAADTVAFSTDGTERARLDASGNLGLGVTPSAWGSDGAIELGAAGNFLYGVTTNNMWLGSNAYFNGTNWIYSASSTASAYQQTLGLHRWFTAPSGTAGNAITFTQAMTLHASGGVSIGNTTDPGATNLSVTGSLTLSSATMDPSGSAPLFAARAWVCFTGTGTVTIRRSGNVTSVTDNGVGDYTVNFTTAMPSVNLGVNVTGTSGQARVAALATTSCGVQTRDTAGVLTDASTVVLTVII